MLWGVKLSTIDVWMLRGNRVFGGPGDHGEAAFPPRPSVVTGAAASAALAAAGRLASTTAHPDRAPSIVQQLFGGRFQLRMMAIEHEGSLWLPAPADLVAFKGGRERQFPEKKEEKMEVAGHAPCPWPEGVKSSLQRHLPFAAALVSESRKKPVSGLWMRSDALQRWLEGEEIEDVKKALRRAGFFWTKDARLGIALDDEAGRPHKGRIYTTEAVHLERWEEKAHRLKQSALVAVFDVGSVPEGLDGMLWRFGGDGRAAAVEGLDKATIDKLVGLGRPKPEWKRVRMIAAQPIVSSAGWLPPGAEENEDKPYLLLSSGVRAEIKAAKVPRAEVLSGWDLAEHRPKDAVRAVPVGSCWWLALEREDPEGLQALWQEGAYSLVPKEGLCMAQKGIGAVWFGIWKDKAKEG